MEKLTKRQRKIVAELLTRMNQRRAEKNYKPVGLSQLPSLPGNPANYYLCDTYQVRRHWRRRPVRK
jgi:hypothetical protein